jgi:DHA2 family multidrug resistance protein
VTKLNLVARRVIAKQARSFSAKGLKAEQAIELSNRLLVKSINTQGQIRFAMDYYQWISLLLFFTIVLIALFPYIDKTIIYLRSDQPAPFKTNAGLLYLAF